MSNILLSPAPGFSIEGGRYFITGGSGFVGRSILSLLKRYAPPGTEITVLSRNPEAFSFKYPEAADNINLIAGDISSFDWPSGEFTHVIHGATDTIFDPVRDGRALAKAVVQGTDRVLDFSFSRNVRKFLYISSGAVYGNLPLNLSNAVEDFEGAPEPTEASSIYGNSKRLAEQLCTIAVKQGLEAKIARLFAFVGPNLPLNGPYAIGNFIRDALRGVEIRIKGDGTPLRTYLFEEDLAIWLAVILKDGASGRAYNVGSDEEIDIASLAHLVSRIVAPGTPVIIEGVRQDMAGRNRYVPSIERASRELGLKRFTPLVLAIQKTAAFHRENG